MTAHQIGTVFDRASGIRFPDLVESTRTILRSSGNKLDRLFSCCVQGVYRELTRDFVL